MSDKQEVQAALRRLKVPHLLASFNRATSPKGGHRTWVDVNEIKSIVSVASRKGPKGIGASEWKAILAIGTYDKLGPKAAEYLQALEKRWNAAAMSQRQGGVVSLTHAAKYKGQSLGDGRLKGQCATGVQLVFAYADKPLGLTRTWKQGALVKGNRIAAGTAIASFRDGRYANDHAAIFIRETKAGIEVWDQWVGKPWGKRTLRFNYKGGSPFSNDGDLFSVIAK
jgi:hypothetical protein